MMHVFLISIAIPSIHFAFCCEEHGDVVENLHGRKPICKKESKQTTKANNTFNKEPLMNRSQWVCHTSPSRWSHDDLFDSVRGHRPGACDVEPANAERSVKRTLPVSPPDLHYIPLRAPCGLQNRIVRRFGTVGQETAILFLQLSSVQGSHKGLQSSVVSSNHCA